MSRMTDRRLLRLETGNSAKKGGIAFVNVFQGESLEEALARQGIDQDEYAGLFIISGRDRATSHRISES